MLKVLLVGLGGFLGAISRFGISQLNIDWGPFPLGTFLANVIGCLLMGFIVQVLTNQTQLPVELHFFFIAGFLGSLTTISAFSLETFEMIELRQIGYAGIYLFLTIFLCLGAVYSGRKLAIWLF